MKISSPTGKSKHFADFILAVTLVLLLSCIRHIRLAAQSSVKPRSAKTSAVAGKSALKSSAPGPGAIQTLRNVGKAYYEQGKYPESAAEFQKVIATGKALATDHMDLALGLMQEDKLDEALGEMTTARQMDPKLVAVDYNLGILYKREAHYPDAEAALKRVIAADPHEPAAWLNLGVVYFSQNKLSDAMAAYQQLLNMGFGRAQNFYVAGLFRMSTALFRLKRSADAQKYLALHAKVKDKVPSVSVQTAALEGGKYGAILVPTTAAVGAGPQRRMERVTFADITARLGIHLPPEPSAGAHPSTNVAKIVHGGAVSPFGPSMTVADYDGDGHPDLYLVLPGGSNHLFHNNGDGTFSDVTAQAAVGGPGGSLSATFADYDNSGHPSLFVAGVGGVTLYHNNGNGTFTDVTGKAELKGKPDEIDSRAVLFDADVDGFLDLVVTGWGGATGTPKGTGSTGTQDTSPIESHFYRNNGDGTFSDITRASGLGSAKGQMRGAVFADFNNDGYTDLLFFRDDGPPMLFINQGEDKFVDRTAEAGPALVRFAAVDAQVADFNHDGKFDLVLWGRDAYSVLLNRGNARFESAPNLPPLKLQSGAFDFHGTVADMNGNGFSDLAAVDGEGKWHLLANRGGRFEDEPLQIPPPAPGGQNLSSPPSHARALAWAAPAGLASPGKLDLLTLTHDGKFAAYEKEGPPARWLEVKLTGSKSNVQGVGAIVELKAGNFYEKVMATGEPVRIFAGDLAKLDVVRVTWPNQIIQNSIAVPTNHPIEMRESERLSSSCPFLYVWDGTRFVYYTDILGMAPLGELSPDGSWSVPNPREFVRLPGDLHPRHGLYTFQVTDEMREADFVDQLRLIAFDHSASEEIYSNEIATSAPVPPSLYMVRQKHPPVSAVDDADRNVLPEILTADGRYPIGFRRNRILGLADTHSLTLDLGDFPADAPVALWLKGWVFWTDSNASRALMTNSKLHMVMPYLQVRDAQGKWVTAVPDMGLPSGTNRTMRVDLNGKFPSRDHHVRIVTNLCVYWDQIFFSIGDRATQEAGTAPVELPLVSADLHYRGFSTPTSDPKHVSPDTFDYVKRMHDAPWNPMRGDYTRYGQVKTLLDSSDDRQVVMSTGDEITVRFDGQNLPPVKPGMKRDFFLYTAGYAKDGEPNTAYSKVVGPLPFRSMTQYPYSTPEHFPNDARHQEYLRQFETRPGHLLIPPMAPAPDESEVDPP
ncbi:MAG TPA: FG-GAP-like repeat-containing protein [Terriglobia bacterium]|nr:FG-GAP-like repeat-containing protein [Terriglobia bacterium]